MQSTSSFYLWEMHYCINIPDKGFLLETEDDSPTDDQLLKCSHQQPNFSHIGDY